MAPQPAHGSVHEPEPARVESDIIQSPAVSHAPTTRASHVSKGGPGRSRNNLAMKQPRQGLAVHEAAGPHMTMGGHSPAVKGRNPKRPRDVSSGSEHDGGARNPKKLPRSGQLDTAISSDRIRHSREHNGDSRTASSARSPGNNGSADIDLSISERSRNQQRPSREHYNSSLVDDGSGGVYNSDDTDDDSDGDIPARIPQSITRTPFVGNTPRPGCQWAPDTAYNQQRAAAQTAREGESGDGSKSHTRSPEVSNSIPPGASAISDAPPVAVSRTESRPDGAGRLAAAQSPRLTPARSGKEHARSPLRSNEAGSAQGTPSSSVSDPATALDPQSATMWELVRPHLVRTDKDHAPTKGYVRDFLKLPKVRELRWNTSWITKNPYVDAHPRDVSSLIMQITGEYAAQPCSKCQEGKGPYEGCVVISPRASPECQLMIVSCANCWYHSGQTYCSHQSMLKERFVALFPDVDVADFSHQVKSAARSGPRKPKGVSSRDTQPRQSKRPGRETNPEATALDQSQQLSTTSERLVTTESAAERATPATETVKSDEPRKEKETLEGRHGFTSDGNKVEAWPGESSLISTGFLGGLGNETLEMEEWEVAPGRIRSEGPNTMENIALSNSFVTAGRMVPVDEGISFRVEVIRMGSTFQFEKDTKTTRICSIAAGKLRVCINDVDFVMGPNGMFKIKPGATCRVENTLYIDAYLHISAVWFA